MFVDGINLFFHTLTFALILLISVAYLSLFERKIIGFIQLRQGPNATGFLGFLQPIADGIKLLHKEIIFPLSAHKPLFIVAPIGLFSLSIAIWAVIPFSKTLCFSNLSLGLLYVLSLSSFSAYGIMLAGWASRSRYALIGALRSIAQVLSYEISMGLIIVCVVMLSSSYSLSDIVEAQTNRWFIIPLFPLWVPFLICSLAETHRAPFDVSESESELVAGYNVEYTSFPYALFYLGEYIHILLLGALNAIFFFGGYLPPLQILSFIPGPFWMILKMSLFFFFCVWVRATLPRFRYDQLMSLGWKVLIPFCFLMLILTSFLLFIMRS